MRGSFEGFLLRYAQELTGCDTSSLKKLFCAVVTDSPRAAEVVLLLALAKGRENYLLRLAHNSSYASDYKKVCLDFEHSKSSIEQWLAQLPEKNRYRKVWNAWQSARTQLERDRSVMIDVRNAIERVLDERDMTRAQACRELGLNKGNFYAFMKGDMSKMSRETAISTWKALTQISVCATSPS